MVSGDIMMKESDNKEALEKTENIFLSPLYWNEQ